MNTIIIPARMGSKRLAEKPLLPIGDIPMVIRVAQQAVQSELAEMVVVATDSKKIAELVWGWDFDKPVKVKMTSTECRTGTDRIASLAFGFIGEDDVVVNLQGDLPFADPRIADQLFDLMLDNPDIPMATVCNIRHLPEHEEMYHSPHSVKVVVDSNNDACLFSRSPIPHDAKSFYHHFGMYAYRREMLRSFADAEQPYIEKLEKLEQLRALHLGIKIRVLATEYEAGQEINTEEDWTKANQEIMDYAV